MQHTRPLLSVTSTTIFPRRLRRLFFSQEVCLVCYCHHVSVFRPSGTCSCWSIGTSNLDCGRAGQGRLSCQSCSPEACSGDRVVEIRRKGQKRHLMCFPTAWKQMSPSAISPPMLWCVWSWRAGGTSSPRMWSLCSAIPAGAAQVVPVSDRYCWSSAR